MRYIDSFDVLEAPKEEPPIPMFQLPAKLKEKGLISPPTRRAIWRVTWAIK